MITDVKISVSPKSSNSKTGPMATTQRTVKSCPPSCPFLRNGCYAAGRIFAVPEKHGELNYSALLALASKPLPYGIRFNVSGDFLTSNGQPDLDYISAANVVADAHPSKAVIAYTHAWRVIPRELFHFTVNASCETEEEAAEAIALGYEVTMVNAPEGFVAGRRVVTCPATTEAGKRNGVTCATCKLCSKDYEGRPVINFPAHGSGARKATEATASKR